jgi:ABC-2 type transport system permease protein
MIASINAVRVTNTENIVSPITTEIATVAKSQTNLGFLFPSLIVMMIMFIGLLLPSTLVIMEKNSRASFRVFTTPTRNWLLVSATFLTSMILIFFQVSIILAVSQFYFKINFLNSFSLLFLSLILIMTFFIILGMVIGHIFNTEEMAMLAAVSIGTLFLLTSGIIFPIESMPSYIVEIVKFNPVVLSADMFKQSLLFSSDFASVKDSFAYLFMFSIILLAVIFLARKSERIIYMLKKPNRIKLKKQYLITLFDFGDRKAKTLAEFIVSLQNLNEDKFNALLKQSVYSDWILLVYKHRDLARKVENIAVKEELINVLVEELKRVTLKQHKK